MMSLPFAYAKTAYHPYAISIKFRNWTDVTANESWHDFKQRTLINNFPNFKNSHKVIICSLYLRNGNEGPGAIICFGDADDLLLFKLILDDSIIIEDSEIIGFNPLRA